MKLKKSYLIILNGEILDNQIIKHFKNRNLYTICADGSIDKVRKLIPDFVPHFVIGDFDSISKKSMEIDNVKYFHATNKNFTDGEKSIVYALTNGATEIDIIGFGGNRLDHTLNHLFLLKKYESQADIRMWDQCDTILYRSSSFNLKVKPENRISFIPFFEKTVFGTCKGLEYTCDNITLHEQPSISNKTTSGEISVEIKEGSVLVVVSHNGFFYFSD